jgi:hypothetical protein
MRLLIPDLLPGRQYAIQIRAKTINGVSEWSNRYLITTMEDTIPPNAPTSLTWVASGDAFAATWTGVTTNTASEAINVVAYELELVVGGTTKILTVPQNTGAAPSFNLSFESNRALFGTPQASIALRVRAVDNKDLKSAWCPAVTATNPAPANPTSIVAVAGLNQISLTFTPPSDTDVIGYNIYIGAAKQAFVTGTSWILSTTNYSATTLTVKTVDKFGQESSGANANTVTPISPFIADTTAPSVPTALAATITNNANDAGATAAVTWTMSSPPSDLAGFVVQYRKVGTTNWTQTTTDKDARALLVPLNEAYVNYEFQIKAKDWSANESTFSATVTATAPSNTAPSQPAAPTATVGTMQIQVSHNGLKNAGGAMEADVVRYNVYASTTTGFTESSANMLGTMQAGPATVQTFNIPASGGGSTQTWYVKVVAVDRLGLTSTASPQTSAAVGLIASANIIDATITSAKIADLAANKITAGTGFINDISVKSKFTLGDASTVGAIESFGYVAGTTGFRFDKNLLEINQGSVAAAALNIQDSHNLMPAIWSDFEANSLYYTGIATSNATATISTTERNFNSQSLRIQTSSASNWVLLGKTVNDWSLNLAPSKTYIVSWYAKNPAGSAATSVTPTIKALTTTATVFGSDFAGTGIAMPNNDTWTRYSTTITTGSNVTGKALLYFNIFSNPTDLYIDGIQVEEKIGALNTPSQWKPPGSTRIDAGLVRTGSIQSTATAQVWDATLNAGMGGYKTDPDAQPAWNIDTEGAATMNDLAVRGRLIVGTQADPTLVDTTKMSTAASATFISGTQGWQLRADGVVEFRDVVAESLHGDALIAGTVKADALTAGTITSNISLSGSFETASSPTEVRFTTTSGSVTVTTNATDPVFSSSDVGITVAGINIPADAKIATVSGTHTATLTVAATGTGTDTDGVLYRGRRVRMSGTTGITLYDQYDTAIVKLPTDPSEPNLFAGSVIATDLYVRDEFRMFGESNSLGQNSILNLEGGQYKPGTFPSVSFTYTAGHMINANGSSYNPSTDPYQSQNNGLFYDPAGFSYIWLNTFLGTYINFNSAPGSPSVEGTRMGSITLHPAFIHTSSDWGHGGMAANHTTNVWYFLTRSSADNSWWMQGISRAGIFRSGGPLPSDRVSAQPWIDAPTGGINGYPAFDNYGGNMYIAKFNSSNKVVIYKYTGGNVNTAASKSTATSITGTGRIVSVKAGQFDYGSGSTYVIVTMAGTTSATRQNFVFREDATEFVNMGWHFPAPYDKSGVIGTVWIGTSHNDTAGYFKTIFNDGTIYKFTKLGISSSATTVRVSQKWRNDGTGGGVVAIGPEGPIGTYGYKRRSIMTMTSSQTIPNAGGDSPNALTFYAGLDAGTRFRYPEPAAGIIQITATDFRTTNAAGTSVAMAAGIPSRILSSSGLEINGNGAIIASSITGTSITSTSTFQVGQNGNLVHEVKWGNSGTVTLNASGQYVMSHGLSSTPLYVVASGRNTGYDVIFVGSTSTTMTFTGVRRSDGATGATIGAVAGIVFDYIAVF